MSDWKRVNAKSPCKVCDKPDWCTASADGTIACCMRIESPKQMTNGGWLHRLADAPQRREYKPEPERLPKAIRWDLLLRQFTPKNGELEHAAESLGVTAESLKMLGCGWDGEALTFPMWNAFGSVIGIRRRFPDGRKLSVTGGREGLFIPSVEKQEWLFVCEGPTDTAALLSLGLYAIGRPSCTGGIESLKIVTQGHRVTVCSDNDGPGRRGALAAAKALGADVISPPAEFKDVRAWVNGGARMEDVLGRTPF